MRKQIFILIAACLVFAGAEAQTEKFVRSGNKLYEEKKYKEAGAAYQKALQNNPTYVPGMFNLGNSLYQQKQFEASRKVLGNAVKTSKDKNSKAGASYNIGNTYMSEQKWEDAVNSYKQALRNNPQDADAKYNLSYALQKLKKEQQDNKNNKDKNDKNKDNKKDKDNKDKGDKDKDKQDKGDKDKDKQDKGDQDKENKEKGDKEEQRPQPQPSKLSEKQAEQLLNALQQEEKKLQDKMQKEKGIPVKTEKDW